MKALLLGQDEYDTNKLNLGRYAKVFQDEEHAINASAAENIDGL
jgi:hypothetical protein